jgi:hypothetical protein
MLEPKGVGMPVAFWPQLPWTMTAPERVCPGSKRRPGGSKLHFAQRMEVAANVSEPGVDSGAVLRSETPLPTRASDSVRIEVAVPPERRSRIHMGLEWVMMLVAGAKGHGAQPFVPAQSAAQYFSTGTSDALPKVTGHAFVDAGARPRNCPARDAGFRDPRRGGKFRSMGTDIPSVLKSLRVTRRPRYAF